MFNGDMPKSNSNYNDSGSASRYFYCAKASKADREEGLEDEIGQAVNDGRKTDVDNPFQRGMTIRKNIHPTVKPTELMRYLVRLVTPHGGIVLDPFNGSGSTGKAVMIENNNKGSNYRYIGIELDENYCAISRKRIDWASGYISEEGENTSETRDYKKSRVGYTPKSLF